MYAYMLIAGVLGVALDFVFGDPVRMPHVVRFAGWVINGLEGFLAKKLGRTILSGFVLWFLVVGLFVLAYSVLSLKLLHWSPWLKVAFDAIVVFQCIAFKDLVKHVRAVQTALGSSIEKARTAVSWIVGRDTDRMDENDVCRAAIESGSENLNDAVIAPLFWYALLGPVGILVYRISNTLDAMVGHHNERFELFGKVSARIDDILNFVPARLCSVLVLKFSDIGSAFKLGPDASKHPSINAGWPEAAMARRLGVVIGGRMYSKGELVETAEMNVGARQPTRKDIECSTTIMREAYLKGLALVLIGFFLVGF